MSRSPNPPATTAAARASANGGGFGVHEVGREIGAAGGVDAHVPHARNPGEAAVDGVSCAADSQAEALALACAAKTMHAKQLALEQNRHPAGHPLDLAEDVGGDEYRALPRQRPDVPSHLDDLVRIEAVGGLVQDEQVRIAQQGLRDGDALAVAARELSDEATPHAAERQTFDRRVHRRCRGPARESFQPGHECQEFLGAHPVVERDILGHIAHPGPRLERIVDNVEPDDAGGSSGGAQVTGEDPQDRGLP